MNRWRVSDEEARRATEEYFYSKIPLTRAMGVRVVSQDGEQFVVEAPVALNHNHLETGFGGSINSVATLAGYGLLWVELRGDADCHVVVKESAIRFLRPVRKTIRAYCARPAEDDLGNFKKKLGATGKASLKLQVSVKEDNVLAAEFVGTFVALKTQSE